MCLFTFVGRLECWKCLAVLRHRHILLHKIMKHHFISIDSKHSFHVTLDFVHNQSIGLRIFDILGVRYIYMCVSVCACVLVYICDWISDFSRLLSKSWDLCECLSMNVLWVYQIEYIWLDEILLKSSIISVKNDIKNLNLCQSSI